MTNVSREWHSLSNEKREIISSFQKEIPVKIGQLAKSFGLVVKVATLDVGISGSIEPVGTSYKVRINKHEPEYRKRFTLAHEVSHYLLHRHLIGSGISDDILYRSSLSDALEAEANRLASDILMPHEKIREWRASHRGLRNADAVGALASHFGVSEEAMRIRIGMKK